MALTASSGMPLTANYMTVMKRTTDGYPAGDVTDPATLVNNTVYNAYLVRSINNLVPAVTSPPLVRQIAGGTVRKSLFLPKADFGIPQVVLEEEDETLIAKFIKDNAVDVTTDSKMAFRDDNPGQSNFPSLIIGFHMFVERGPATGFTQMWDNWFYLNCQLQQSAQSNIGQITGNVDNPSELTYDLALSLSDRSVTGEKISALNTSNANGFAAVQYIRTEDAPLMTSLYIDDGAAGTATFPYKPVGSDATGAAGNHVTKNGTVSTITSFSTTTAVAVFVAGSATDKWVFCYQNNFVTP